MFVVAVVLICVVVPACKALCVVVVVFQSKSMMCFYLCIQPSHNGANTRDKKESKFIRSEYCNHLIVVMGKKQLSGARKRKKKKEREELALEMERLKLGPTKLWTGLVVHHRDVFVSHVISKLNRTDRRFFSKVNGESWDVLEYAGVNVSGLSASVYECSSISTLEWAWNNMPWGKKDERWKSDRSSLVLS